MPQLVNFQIVKLASSRYFLEKCIWYAVKQIDVGNLHILDSNDFWKYQLNVISCMSHGSLLWSLTVWWSYSSLMKNSDAWFNYFKWKFMARMHMISRFNLILRKMKLNIPFVNFCKLCRILKSLSITLKMFRFM